MKLQNGCGEKFNLKAVDTMNVDDIICFLEIYSNCANANIECNECPLYKKSCLKLEGKIIDRSIEFLREINNDEHIKQKNVESMGN